MSKEIQDQIDVILAEKGITYDVRYMGEKAAFDEHHKMDWWSVVFTTDNKREDFDYFTGLGHRKWDKPHSAKKILLHGTKSYNYTYQDLGKPGTVHYEQMARTNLKPVVPHIAGVLYSLVMDSDALEHDYEDWCDNLGFDADSRKALETFLQCQKLGKQLQSIFSRDVLEQIKTLLEDY